MDVKGTLLKEAIVIIFLSSVAVSAAVRNYGFCDGEIRRHTFQCFNGNHIDRAQYCDGKNDCTDGSDEYYCKGSSLTYYSTKQRYSGSSSKYNTYYYSSTSRLLTYCADGKLYLPVEWMCDRILDCSDKSDEVNCGYTVSPLNSSLYTEKRNAIRWIHNKTVPASATQKWGPLVHKTTVALYLSDSNFVNGSSSVRKEIAYELAIQFLSKLSQKRMYEVSSNDLATFINSFLVTCINPRDFYGFNLVQELRKRVDKQKHPNPYFLLALCNAGDTITESDVTKLSHIFWSNNRELWMDTQAGALMALSCARNHTKNSVDPETISKWALVLKNHQYSNGTVGNLLSTLLVMQALYSAEADEDADNFNETKAMTYILESQKPDGSFGNFLLTYYALPVLNCKSMVDIGNNHCEAVSKDEDIAMFDLINRVGPKIRIRYSIWIGTDKDVERTLTMKVPANSSFYQIMEIAAEIDSKYTFEYVVKNGMPYISALSGIIDEAEAGHFWFPYIMKDDVPTPLNTSTAEVIPQANDHIVMWYRKGTWVQLK